MSVEVDSPGPLKTKKRRTIGPERIEKKKKKRKKSAVKEDEPTATHKKHQAHSPKEESRREGQLEVLGPSPTPQTSPLYEQTSSLYLPIAPIAQSRPTSALCAEHVSPLLLSYYPPFHGVLISYSNPRLSSTAHDIPAVDGRQKAFARSTDEYAATFVWLTAEFLIFRPQKGDVIEGYINLQSESSIGIVYWNFFNASIERRFLPKDWEWRPAAMSAGRNASKGRLNKAGKAQTGPADDNEGEEVQEEGQAQATQEHDVGHFQTGQGRRIEGRVRFYVKDVDTSRSTDQEHKFLGIEGTMLEPIEENAASKAG